jgi:hypothetical protein
MKSELPSLAQSLAAPNLPLESQLFAYPTLRYEALPGIAVFIAARGSGGGSLVVIEYSNPTHWFGSGLFLSVASKTLVEGLH